MMMKLFNLIQLKTEKVNCFATRLETTVADIRKDHPEKMTRVSAEDDQTDTFYQSLKKTLKDPYRYLYDTGASDTQILKASRTAETEADNFKKVKVAKVVYEDDSKVLGELAAIKFEVRIYEHSHFLLVERILVSRRRKLEQCLPQMWRVGHFAKDCSSPGDDLNSQWEGEKVQGPSPHHEKRSK